MALVHGEYRESEGIDFLVSSMEGYRELRGRVKDKGIESLFTRPVSLRREVRTDQYGIRTAFDVDGLPIKFEIVFEGRIALDSSQYGQLICGVPTLTLVDMAAEKLLANSDRWADDSAYSRDLIDLAMLPDGKIPAVSFDKATRAYGNSIERDLKKAIEYLFSRTGRLYACMERLSIDMPEAVLWKKIKNLTLSRR